jgi:hypothetical protein
MTPKPSIDTLRQVAVRTSRISTNAWRNIFILFLVVPLVAVLWFSGASTEPVPPAGALAESYEAEVLAGIRSAGGQPGQCSMSGNVNLGVTCKAKITSLAALVASFQARGWNAVQSQHEGIVLTRQQERMSIEVWSQDEVAISVLRLRS